MIADPRGTDGPVEVTRHEERVTVGVSRTPHRVVRIRRRIVTEVRLIEVEVRSEVIDIDWHDADVSDADVSDADVTVGGEDAGATGGGDGGEGGSEPRRLEFVLHGEEPEIRLVTVAKERIILNRVTVPGTEEVGATVRSERIAIDQGRPARSVSQ